MNKFMQQELEKQFNRAKNLGWIAFYFEAVAKFTENYFDVADLMAKDSRESNLNPKYLKIAGDNGNGFGLSQIDRRSFPEFVQSGKWKDARESILKGADVLMQKWRQIESGQRKVLKVRSSRSGKTHTFTAKEIAGFDAQRVSLSAYNCGLWAYYAFSNSKPIDSFTTDKNYSADVIERAKIFRQLLRELQRENFRDLRQEEIKIEIPKPYGNSTIDNFRIPEPYQEQEQEKIVESLNDYGKKPTEEKTKSLGVSFSSNLMAIVGKISGYALLAWAIVEHHKFEIAVAVVLILAVYIFYTKSKERANQRKIASIEK